jgi:hypothetical protein
MSPAINQQGWVQTWVTSQWKNRPIPGQFSVEMNKLPFTWSMTFGRNGGNGDVALLRLSILDRLGH